MIWRRGLCANIIMVTVVAVCWTLGWRSVAARSLLTMCMNCNQLRVVTQPTVCGIPVRLITSITDIYRIVWVSVANVLSRLLIYYFHFNSPTGHARRGEIRNDLVNLSGKSANVRANGLQLPNGPVIVLIPLLILNWILMDLAKFRGLENPNSLICQTYF